jgi:hypothetical protein
MVFEALGEQDQVNIFGDGAIDCPKPSEKPLRLPKHQITDEPRIHQDAFAAEFDEPGVAVEPSQVHGVLGDDLLLNVTVSLE